MNCRDAFGNSALHIAAQANQKEIAVFLIQSGLAPDVKNKKGQKNGTLISNAGEIHFTIYFILKLDYHNPIYPPMVKKI